MNIAKISAGTKVSLILMVWNTSHLMKRTLETLKQQTMPAKDWELIIVDDNSLDDVEGTLNEHGKGLPIRYYRLDHSMGMRGNTVSLNYGIRKAQGNVVMWSTPEVMLAPHTLDAVYETHLADQDKALWVTVPSHGLTQDLQMKIDTVDWRDDVHNIKQLVDGVDPDHWDSVWFHLNYFEHGCTYNAPSKNYGNNQTVAVVRWRWESTIGRFPYFCDYGSDDPWIADERRKHNFKDVTLWSQEAYHQWHIHGKYWIAQDLAPYWNHNSHTIDNLLGDPLVPVGGTCEIWDQGVRTGLSRGERQEALMSKDAVDATGFRWR